MRVLITSAGCVAKVAAIAAAVPAAKFTPVLERPSYMGAHWLIKQAIDCKDAGMPVCARVK